MSKHTPGPWRLDKHTNCDIVAANGTLEIATTHEDLLTGGYRDPSTAQADAKLIAAAPCVGAKLKEARSFIGKQTPDASILREIDETLEKAGLL